MSRNGAVRKAIAMCAAGFDRPDIPEAVLALMHEAVPFNLAAWGLLDPVSQLPTSISSTAEAVLCEPMWEHELTVPDVVMLRDVLHNKPPVGILSIATGGNPAASPRFRRVLNPQLAVTDELRAALVVGGVGWGGSR